MKKYFYLLPVLALLFSCEVDDIDEPDGPDGPFERNPIVCSAPAKELVKKSNDMSWNLLEHSLSPKKNTLLSPFSLSACLAMVDNGAAGDTEEEIRRFLGYGDYSQSEFNDIFRFLLSSLPKVDTSVKFTAANSFWYANTHTPKASFANTLKDYYFAESFAVDFKDNGTINKINKWCSEKTNNLIPKFVDRLSPELVSMLINAIYFKGAWNEEFDKSLTKADDFHKADGTTSRPDFMHRTSTELALDNDIVSIVQLSMGKSGLFQTFFVLPKEGKTLAEAAEAAQQAFCDTQDMLQNGWDLYKVKMSIPKFTVESKQSLRDVLKSMGFVKPFAQGDFSNMFEGNAFVGLSDVKQACFFSINEKEVQAAAVTGTDWISSPGPAPQRKEIEFNLNRPFLYGIYEFSSNIILFVGSMQII